MDESPNFHLLEQLPTENEIIQNNNNVQTPKNNNPLPIYDNNIPQEVMKNNNNERTTNSIPPSKNTINIPQDVTDNNINESRQTSFAPPPIYGDNIEQEVTPQSDNIPIQYLPPSPKNPELINEPINIQNPLNQNDNTYSSQMNINSNDLNLYDKPIDLPPNIPTPQIEEMKQIPEEPKLEVKKPVYKLNTFLNESENNPNDCGCRCRCCCRKCYYCEECCRRGEWVKWFIYICVCIVILLGGLRNS